MIWALITLSKILGPVAVGVGIATIIQHFEGVDILRGIVLILTGAAFYTLGLLTEKEIA